MAFLLCNTDFSKVMIYYKTYIVWYFRRYTMYIAVIEEGRWENICFIIGWIILPLVVYQLINHSFLYGSQLLGQDENSKFWVTWLSFAQFVYFLRKMCLLFNFWMIKFTFVVFLTFTHEISQWLSFAQFDIFWGKCVFLTCRGP